jgi:cytochrome bd-type quinol oxidase subunit 2
MFKNTRNKIIALASVLLLAAPMAVPAFASATTPPADVTDSLCQGATLDITTNTKCSANTTNGTTGINSIIHDVINIFSLVVGVVSVIMIIVGGFRYITSGGESSNVSGAKNTIIYAIIGLVVVALAQFIVQFVLNKVTST